VPQRGAAHANRDELRHVHDSFTEGFDTPDLAEAALLLGGAAEALSRDDARPT